MDTYVLNALKYAEQHELFSGGGFLPVTSP